MTKLSPNGIFVTQAGPGGFYSAHEVCIPVYNTLSSVFKYTSVYSIHTPAFFDHYAFVMASNSVDAKSVLQNGNIEQMIEDKVDATHELNADSTAVGNNVPRCLDADVILSNFVFPKWFKKQLEEQKDVLITEDKPAFLS